VSNGERNGPRYVKQQSPLVSKNSDNSEPLILAIETGTRAGSVALARGQETLDSAAGDPTASHSTNLIEIVEKTLNGHAELKDIDLFAAAVGPGSFTGLRIGLATVKAFAACTGKKCVAVSTLAAIAHAAGASESTVALLPAGRGEVYAQMFSVANEDVRALDTAVHITPGQLLQKDGSLPQLRWAGDGARMHFEALRAWANAKQIPLADGRAEDSGEAGWGVPAVAARGVELAVSVAALGLKEYRKGNAVGADDLRAVYVRPSDAEINERWQQEKSLPPIPA
jgi:tRNA threonylcarbamoyladenosine biosynthesis protein TsaB